jgi:hypothetical protein
MKKQHSLEQIRQQSIRVWADAQKQAMHEAVRNNPVNPIIQNVAASAAGLGTGSGGALTDDTENNYVVNDYVENYFE